MSDAPTHLRLGKKTPGSAPYGFVWESTNDVLEVPVEYATDFIISSHGDIYEVLQDGQVSEIDPVESSSETSPAPARSETVFDTAGTDIRDALSVARGTGTTRRKAR